MCTYATQFGQKPQNGPICDANEKLLIVKRGYRSICCVTLKSKELQKDSSLNSPNFTSVPDLKHKSNRTRWNDTKIKSIRHLSNLAARDFSVSGAWRLLATKPTNTADRC